MMSTLSADPVASMNSLYGLNAKQFTYSSNSRHTVTQLVALSSLPTSAAWASTTWLALLVPDDLVSQLEAREKLRITTKNLN